VVTLAAIHIVHDTCVDGVILDYIIYND